MAEEKTTKAENAEVKETKNENKDNVTKVKMKPKKAKDDIVKVDLSKPPINESEEVEQQPAEKEEEVVVVNEEPKEEVKEEIKEETKEEQEETPVIQEITEDQDSVEEVQEEVEEAIAEAESTGNPLPENIQKLVDFMKETGGDINDYVKLNRDVSKMDDSDVLDEYYKTTKSHLTAEERSFLLEESFGYDEEVDDPKDIRKKKIALKEQVAEARAHLDRQKSKYYEDIKAGSKLTAEQQKAVDFFNRYNKENEERKKQTERSNKTFLKRTNDVFNNKFKGFDYEVGDKKFRFNVKDVTKVKETQSDLNNFINKFVGEDSTIKDAKGYHKSLFTAMNADTIAKHFYEQGKADAIKETVAKDKNINLEPRKTHGETNVGGVKFKVLGNSASDFKFKINRKK
tara:strand:+ start:2860 stop:4059 length:1200 start_codon:yes stop_codon:yes gene_type:complete